MKYFFDGLIAFDIKIHVADIPQEIGEFRRFTFDLKG